MNKRGGEKDDGWGGVYGGKKCAALKKKAICGVVDGAYDRKGGRQERESRKGRLLGGLEKRETLAAEPITPKRPPHQTCTG